ncbi:DUF1294 domain-containing protein [Oleiharenicola lentus]|jgi:uncharacterized membrane protein YsdA (DUF1294 family)|uniref:DUF1294 domain-containing protein n=1 Tax=Oleiharenicola lentus TaxID=2508720 RepID=A0A4V1M6W0_9BACT|nr:DUF1294 domain-containing protein [Oleiharenicola lentus]RXK56769.1 DUF1294 domain-containing protein [Oleiharenicola lentus]
MRDNSRSSKQGGSLSGGSLMVLAGLLVLPGWAMARVLEPQHGLWGGVWGATASLITFVAYWHDKRSAQAQGWRTPEGILHLLELLGGWPGALIAQRWFRHKTVKVSYQVVFWLIVALHQLVAIDALRGWVGLKGLLR